jgi:hypothetical protein
MATVNFKTPISWNRYTYVNGDPVNFKDPQGGCAVSADDDENGDSSPDFCPPAGGPDDPTTPPYLKNPPVADHFTVATYGSSSGVITVTNFSNSGAKENQIASVLRKIEDALSSYSDCSNWLQAGGVSGADLIQALLDNGNFGYGTFNQNSVAAFAGQVNADGTPVGVPSTAALTVNANGAFFQANATAGSRFKVGTPGYIGGTLQAQATILIHELAHILGAAGFQPDAGNATAGSANDKLVNQDCGKLIGGLK